MLDADWFCPDIESYTIQKWEQSLEMIIDTCSNVKSVLASQGIEITQQCENDTDTIDNYVNWRVYFHSQYIAKYFNLDIYLEQETLDYMGFGLIRQPLAVGKPVHYLYAL